MEKVIKLLQTELNWSRGKCEGFIDGLEFYRATESFTNDNPEYVEGFELGLEAYVYNSSLINMNVIQEAINEGRNTKTENDN